MTKVVYEIVQHDGGWAYRVGEVFSETFPSHDAARAAAEDASQLPVQSTPVSQCRSTVQIFPRDPRA